MTLFVILIFLLIIGSVLIWTVANGIGPTPTSPKAKAVILKHLPNKVCGDIIEAGSGWGTLVFALAKRYPENQVIGYENSPAPFLFSKLLQLIFGSSNLSICYGNFLKSDFSQAGLIFSYLYPNAMEKIERKWFSEASDECWLISNTFSLPNLHENSSYIVPDLYHSKIYVYNKKI